MARWKDADFDILMMIFKHFNITEQQNLITCKTWYSVIEELKKDEQKSMLLFKDGRYMFPDDGQVYRFPQVDSAVWECLGCSHGWVLMGKKETTEVCLMNPFTSTAIELPPFPTETTDVVAKVVLRPSLKSTFSTMNPEVKMKAENYILLVHNIFDKGLWLYTPSLKGWMHLEMVGMVVDFIYINGFLYVIADDNTNRVQKWNLSEDDYNPVCVETFSLPDEVPQPNGAFVKTNYYALEKAGRLLVMKDKFYLTSDEKRHSWSLWEKNTDAEGWTAKTLLGTETCVMVRPMVEAYFIPIKKSINLKEDVYYECMKQSTEEINQPKTWSLGRQLEDGRGIQKCPHLPELQTDYYDFWTGILLPSFFTSPSIVGN